MTAKNHTQRVLGTFVVLGLILIFALGYVMGSRPTYSGNTMARISAVRVETAQCLESEWRNRERFHAVLSGTDHELVTKLEDEHQRVHTESNTCETASLNLMQDEYVCHEMLSIRTDEVERAEFANASSIQALAPLAAGRESSTIAKFVEESRSQNKTVKELTRLLVREVYMRRVELKQLRKMCNEKDEAKRKKDKDDADARAKAKRDSDRDRDDRGSGGGRNRDRDSRGDRDSRDSRDSGGRDSRGSGSGSRDSGSRDSRDSRGSGSGSGSGGSRDRDSRGSGGSGSRDSGSRDSRGSGSGSGSRDSGSRDSRDSRGSGSGSGSGSRDSGSRDSRGGGGGGGGGRGN